MARKIAGAPAKLPRAIRKPNRYDMAVFYATREPMGFGSRWLIRRSTWKAIPGETGTNDPFIIDDRQTIRMGARLEDLAEQFAAALRDELLRLQRGGARLSKIHVAVHNE